jgi:hypothetical protein
MLAVALDAPQTACLRGSPADRLTAVAHRAAPQQGRGAVTAPSSVRHSCASPIRRGTPGSPAAWTLSRRTAAHFAGSNASQIAKTDWITKVRRDPRLLRIGFASGLRAERRRSRTYPPAGYAGLADLKARQTRSISVRKRGFRPASVRSGALRCLETGTNSGTKFWRRGFRGGSIRRHSRVPISPVRQQRAAVFETA